MSSSNIKVTNFSTSTLNVDNINYGIANTFNGTFFASVNANATNITQLMFPSSDIVSFTINITVSTSTSFEFFTLEGVQTISGWILVTSSQGDITGVVFSINNSTGQLYYTSPLVATFRFIVTQTSKSGTYNSLAMTTIGNYIMNSLSTVTLSVSGVSNLNGNSNTIGSIITTGGNIGVGTVTPGYKLHVSGDIYASGNITSFSDIRLKENIVQLSGCLEKINNIRGVSFDRIDTGIKHIGLIAQEVQDKFPELVSTDYNTGFKSVNYGNVVAVLLECIKELKVKVNDLNTRMI